MSHLLRDDGVIKRRIFLTDTSGTNPLKTFELQLSAHTTRHSHTLAMEPVLALVTANHETIVMRLPTDAP